MPEPPGFVVKNGTKRLAEGGRPGPSSSTRISRAGPDEALPGLPLLVPQRPAHVGEHEELHRLAALAEGAPAQVETPGRPGEGRLGDAGRLALEERGEAQGRGVEADEPLGRRPEQALSRPVRELELRRGVEGEHGDVDLLHHLAEESGGLESAEALLAEGLGEGVHLGEGLAEGVVAPADAGAEGEVLLAQGAEEVRERLERTAHRLARGGGEAEPEDRDQGEQRPLRAWGEVAPGQEDRSEDEARQPRAEREELDAAVVGEPAPPARGGRPRTAAGGGRGRCGTDRASPRPG
jgi:hypothetical protein